MLRLNNYPIARALSSARSPARVSSLPHSHRRPCTPPLGSPVLVRGGPASLGHTPYKTTCPEGWRKRPDSEEGCSDPKELRTFAPFISFGRARIPASQAQREPGST